MSNFGFIATIEDGIIFYFGSGNTPEEALSNYLAGAIRDSIDGGREDDESAEIEVSSVIHHSASCEDDDCECEEFWVDGQRCSWITNGVVRRVPVTWSYDPEEFEVSNIRIKEGGSNE